MEPALEYVFGTGAGEPTRWLSAADADPDADGVCNAVWLDFDGDGRRDDLLWDTDGDGAADVAALDLDDDGSTDHYFRDTGNGVWAVPTPRPGEAPAPVSPAPPAPPAPPAVPSESGGSRVERLDLDGDGVTEVELIIDGGRVRQLSVDDDHDGIYEQVITDTDGDGVADRYVAGPIP